MSFPRYPKYKDSGVEWLGQVPEHWAVDRLKWSIRDCRNGIWGDEAKGNDGDIACVRVADFDRVKLRVQLDEPTIRNVTAHERASRLLARGDLLLEKSGGGDLQPVGCVVLFDDHRPAICSNFVARMRMAKGQEPSFWRYLHAAAYAVRLNERSIKQTSGIQNLDQQQYLDEVTVFPPTGEQKAIAAFLDHETAKIDTLVAEQERLIELLKEKRQAVISHTVTKGLNPDAPMKDSGVAWLGKVPAHWEVVPIGHLCVALSYGFTNPMPTAEAGPYLLTANDIDYGRVRYESARRTTEVAFRNELTEKSRPQKDDLLITKDGTLGRVALHDGTTACINQSVAFLRLRRERILPEFAALSLLAPVFQDRMEFDAGGTTIKHIYISRLAKMPLLVPPLAEQRSMCLHIDKEAGVLGRLLAEAERATNLLRERRSALISAAVTGQIDVRPESMRTAA